MNGHDERRNFERWLARGFTIVGGIFWTATAFAGPYVFGDKSVIGAFSLAAFPLAFTIGVLALGWWYERFTAVILGLGAVGTIVWGVIMGWEMSVWMIMIAFFITPTIIAAVLYYLAGKDEGDPAAELIVRADMATRSDTPTSLTSRPTGPASEPAQRQ